MSEDFGQRFNDVFDPFIRRKQAKGKQHCLSLDTKLIPIVAGIDKRHVVQARNYVDLLRCNAINFLEQALATSAITMKRFESSSSSHHCALILI